MSPSGRAQQSGGILDLRLMLSQTPTWFGCLGQPLVNNQRDRKMDLLERRIAARRVVIEQADAEFMALAEMLGGPYLPIGEVWEPTTPERGELLRSVLRKYRPAMQAAWNSAT